MNSKKRKFSPALEREEIVLGGGLKRDVRSISPAHFARHLSIIKATTPYSFPSLVFCHIFQYLELVDLVRLSSVAKPIQSEVNKYMWTLNQIVFPHGMESVSEDVWNRVLFKCPHLTYLDTSACLLPADTIVDIVKRCPQLKIVRTAYDRWDHELDTANRNQSLHLLENVPHNMERMSLCVSDVHKLQQQLPLCQNLRALTLWRTHLLPNILTPHLPLPSSTRTLKLFSIDFEHNAMRDCLSAATNLRSLKIRDCYYDDASELAPLSSKHLTKLEIMHSPVGESLSSIDPTSLVKFGIDWCPGVTTDVQPDVLAHTLSHATRLRSLKLSSGSINHTFVSKLTEANPIPRSLQKLEINTFSSCNVPEALVDTVDSCQLLHLFPDSLLRLSLGHFPHAHKLPLQHFPYLRVLQLSEVGEHLEDLESSLHGLTHLSELSLKDMLGASSFKIRNKSVVHVVMDKCQLMSLEFNGCPNLEHVRIQELSNITKFTIEPSCRHIQKLVVKRCPTLHHYLLSTQFHEMKKALLSLNTIKIEDCEFCYTDVRLCLEYMKTQLLCALVDLSTERSDVGHVKKMQHQVTSACDRLVSSGISSCPKDLSDITVEPSMRVVTNFPFCRWIEVLSGDTLPIRRKSISDWMFCMFKVNDYCNLSY